MRLIALLVLGLLWLEGTAESGNQYFKAFAESGDGVYSLLRRYHLDKFHCNHKEFYKINQLKKNAALQAGKPYFLPILIYKYDKKSIRSTVGIKDWNQAVRIRDFNYDLVDKGFFKDRYERNRKLFVPFHELKCPPSGKVIPELDAIAEVPKSDPKPTPKPEVEPSTPNEVSIENITKQKGRNYPIFGKKYAYTPQVNQMLKGKVYYVVSGHGGPDPGAVGKRAKKELCEDEYAYDVALRLTRLLIAHGATAYMIIRDNDGIRDGKYLKCDTDEVVWGGQSLPRSQKPRLFQRSNKINELYEKHKKQGVTEQKNIVIHIDSRSKKERADVFFYYFPDSKSGKRLAQRIHRVIGNKYRKYRSSGKYSGTVTGRDLHMLRECKPTSVYIELGNIRNPSDQKRFVIQSNRQALAQWLFEGMVPK